MYSSVQYGVQHAAKSVYDFRLTEQIAAGTMEQMFNGLKKISKTTKVDSKSKQVTFRLYVHQVAPVSTFILSTVRKTTSGRTFRATATKNRTAKSDSQASFAQAPSKAKQNLRRSARPQIVCSTNLLYVHISSDQVSRVLRLQVTAAPSALNDLTFTRLNTTHTNSKN